MSRQHNPPGTSNHEGGLHYLLSHFSLSHVVKSTLKEGTPTVVPVANFSHGFNDDETPEGVEGANFPPQQPMLMDMGRDARWNNGSTLVGTKRQLEPRVMRGNVTFLIDSGSLSRNRLIPLNWMDDLFNVELSPERDTVGSLGWKWGGGEKGRGCTVRYTVTTIE